MPRRASPHGTILPLMSAAETPDAGGAPRPHSSGLVAAPGETESRSPLRWLARVTLVIFGLPKSVLFNLRYLPLAQAIRLPVLVSHRLALFNFGGSVELRGPVRTGTVLLGFGANGGFDFRRERSVWQVAGDVVFEGSARLGNGFKLSIASSGRVVFGPEFILSAESQIICRESIAFGHGCLISWDVLVLDSDFHPIVGEDGRVTPTQEPISFGDRVWIGARATVLKGVVLGDDVIVAAGAVVARSEPASNVVIGGNPARVLREGVRWSR
jgi:acetyltransferase-like isoleucine patch superfamily enzyme